MIKSLGLMDARMDNNVIFKFYQRGNFTLFRKIIIRKLNCLYTLCVMGERERESEREKIISS